MSSGSTSECVLTHRGPEYYSIGPDSLPVESHTVRTPPPTSPHPTPSLHSFFLCIILPGTMLCPSGDKTAQSTPRATGAPALAFRTGCLAVGLTPNLLGGRSANPGGNGGGDRDPSPPPSCLETMQASDKSANRRANAAARPSECLLGFYRGRALRPRNRPISRKTNPAPPSPPLSRRPRILAHQETQLSCKNDARSSPPCTPDLQRRARRGSVHGSSTICRFVNPAGVTRGPTVSESCGGGGSRSRREGRGVGGNGT